MARIAVYGAGIFGLSVAWSLLRRGARVEVIDPNGPASGASGGIVGALAPHVPENWNEKKAFQFDSLDMAESFWAEVAGISGQDPGYARSGRVQPLWEADRPLAQARAENAKSLWQGRYTWEIGAPGPYAVWLPKDVEAVIHDSLSARIHPRRATLALAEAVQRLGGEIRGEAEGGAEVEVWATGTAGLQDLCDDLHQPVGNAVKGQAALMRIETPDMPQIFVETLHIIPHGDGTVAIGSTSERDTETLTTDGQLDALIAKARAVCPALADAPVVGRWAGLRPRARSRAPMLGRHPKRDQIFIANGGFKIGFGMAPKVGEVMANLILTGEDAIPDSFRVEASLR